jgi:hypothetical protein
MKYLLLLSALFFCQLSWGLDTDTIIPKKVIQNKKTDTPAVKIHSPRKAAILSAVVPGLGQVYNKKYWKVPLVYIALGTSAGFFLYNRREYIDARDAYRNKLDNNPDNDADIQDKFKPVDPESIRRYRNGVRQYVDYSVLAFILCWGLNVVDAAVDAHLKSFELTENLTMHVNPYINPGVGSSGMQLVFDLGKRKTKLSKISY